MAVTFFPFNSIVVDGVPDRPANAENLAAYLAGFFSSGVVMQEDTALKVEAYSGMKVQIHAGMGNINGKTILADAAEIVTLAAANASLARIDRVVFRLDETNRIMEFDVLKGTPASSPVAPALTRNSSIYEMCLAEIRVPAGATSIAASYITDTRSNLTICGASQIPEHSHKDILWSNASPSSSFAGQTVTVSGLEDYDEFAIEFKGYCQADYRQISHFKKGHAGTLIGLTYSDTYVRYYLHNRGFTFTAPNKLTFDSNYAIDLVDGKASASNTSIIPVAIYGIKGVQ